jgi:hypothetical protein
MASDTTYGRGLQMVVKQMVVPIGTFTANSTVTTRTGFGVPAGRKFRITSLSVVSDAIPADPDGTMLLNILARDVSEGAADSLVASADLETLVTEADKAYGLTLATETSEKEFTLEAGDTIYATKVNNSAAIGTNANLFLVIEYFIVPSYPETTAVGHPSNYIV